MISLCFFPTAERLKVLVVQARDLRFEDQIFGGGINFLFSNELVLILDSFVKITMIKNDPKQSESFETKTVFQNSNPVFNETCVFQLSTKEFTQSKLKFVIYETNRDHNVAIGSFFIGASLSSSLNCHWNQVLKKIGRNVILFRLKLSKLDFIYFKVILWHPIFKF